MSTWSSSLVSSPCVGSIEADAETEVFECRREDCRERDDARVSRSCAPLALLWIRATMRSPPEYATKDSKSVAKVHVGQLLGSLSLSHMGGLIRTLLLIVRRVDAELTRLLTCLNVRVKCRTLEVEGS